MNTKLSFATLALGSFLTLLGPTAAVAQGRDDYRQNDNRGYTNSSLRNHPETRRERELRLRLELERLERERLAETRWNRNHRYNDNHYNNGYNDRDNSWRR